MKTLRAVAFALLAASCSTPSSGGGGTHPQGSSAPVTTDATTATGPAGPSAAECSSLFAHAVAIRVAEQQKTLPPERLPTQPEQAELRAKLEADAGPACRSGSRETYACAMAAKTLAELDGCR